MLRRRLTRAIQHDRPHAGVAEDTQHMHRAQLPQGRPQTTAELNQKQEQQESWKTTNSWGLGKVRLSIKRVKEDVSRETEEHWK